MSEYWKSLPRKFCEACKCWFADNKASIEFHERGKKHQENVKKRVSAIMKKGQKEWKQKQEYDDDMKKIEEAALRAYQKDLAGVSVPAKLPKTLPEVGPVKSTPKEDRGPKKQYHQHHNRKQNFKPKSEPPSVSESTKEPSWITSVSPEGYTYYYNSETGETSWTAPKELYSGTDDDEIAKSWYECKSEDDKTYYYNTKTGESKWEAPESGYISLEEQNKASTAAADQEEKSGDSDTEQKNPEESDIEQEHSEGSDTEQEHSEESDTDQKNPEASDKEEKDEGENSSSSETDEDDSSSKVPIGPVMRHDPYGQWKTIEKEKPKMIDLQLPDRPKKAEVYIPVPQEEVETKIKFREKTVKSIDSGGSEGGFVAFKKRKAGSQTGRSVRKRLDDD